MQKRTYLIFFALLISAICGTSPVQGSSAAQPQDLLQILPDGSGVIVVDLQKVTTSALWSTVSAQQKLKGFIDKTQSEISDFGLKLNDMRSMALVFPSAGLKNPLAAINGRFDEKEVLARLRANTRIKLTTEKYKNFDVYKVQPLPPTDAKSSSGATDAGTAAGRSDTSFVFRDQSTVVFGAAEGVRASIDVINGVRPSISQNSALSEGLAQSPTSAIRFAITGMQSVTNSLQSSELPIPDFSTLKLIYGSIDIASGIDVNATLRSDTDEHARSIADRLNGLLEMARGYLGATPNSKSASIADALKAVSITSSNAEVKVTGSLSADLLGSLFNPTEKKRQ